MLKETGSKGVDWIHLAQISIQLWAPGNFFTESLLASQNGHCSTEFVPKFKCGEGESIATDSFKY
jgi:hypothetical protein